MTAEQFSRTELLLGREAMELLKGARVAVFGIGGVGGYVVEALARSGVGSLDLIDRDTVSYTHLYIEGKKDVCILYYPELNEYQGCLLYTSRCV